MIHPTTLGNCPTCSKPLSGRGKCRSYAHVAIGPRKVGDITTNWTGNRAEILAINSGSDNANIGENVTSMATCQVGFATTSRRGIPNVQRSLVTSKLHPSPSVRRSSPRKMVYHMKTLERREAK
jgi:hypothetical protein